MTVAIAAVASVALIFTATPPTHAAAASATFYVDCAAGSAINTGNSPSSPWSIQRLHQVPVGDIRAGDRVLLKRGTVCEGTGLNIRWSGSAQAPIVVDAYGTGADPVIANAGSGSNVRISGAYVTVQHLTATFGIRSGTGFAMDDPACAIDDDPIRPGRQVNTERTFPKKYGFEVAAGASFITLRNVNASNATAGAQLERGTRKITVLNSTFESNGLYSRLSMPRPGETIANDDLGAWGVNYLGDDIEIGHSTFRNNVSQCAFENHRLGSNSMELYESSRAFIHHNLSVGDRVFTEMGSTNYQKVLDGTLSERIASDNVFAFNVMVSNLPDAKLLIVRGGERDAVANRFGPTPGTIVSHNTVYLPSAGSTGVSCGPSCSPSILRMHSNVIHTTGRPVSLNSPTGTIETANVLWSTTPSQRTGPGISSASIAQPLFANLTADATIADLTPAAGSPQIDRNPGYLMTPESAMGVTTDIRGTAITASTADAGAIDRIDPIPSSTTTTAPAPTTTTTRPSTTTTTAPAPTTTTTAPTPTTTTTAPAPTTTTTAPAPTTTTTAPAPTTTTTQPVRPTQSGGYRLATADGRVMSFSAMSAPESTASMTLTHPVVGTAKTPSGNGSWLVASDGGIFSFGDARFYGSTGAIRLNQPIVGMTSTPTGNGYWMVASDGGIFSFGDARFYGSTGGRTLRGSVVGITTH